MARYRITAPTGETFEITAPDGASENEVMAYAQKQFSAQPAPEPMPAAEGMASAGVQEGVDQTADMAKSFGSGLVKGAVGMATLPQTMQQVGSKINEKAGGPMLDPQGLPSRALSKIADALPAGGFGLSPLIRGVIGGQPNITNDKVIGAIEGATGPLYKPQTTAGEYAQTVGEFVPGGLGPGGIGRKAVNVLAPAIGSETAGQMTRGSDYEGAARIVGGLGGAMVPQMARRAVTPFPQLDPEHARLVSVLDQEGVRLTAGDRTGNKAVRWAESVANDTPFAGQRIGAEKAAQAEDFTAAILRRVGENDRRVTGPVIDNAFRRIGGEFGRLAANNTMRADQQLVADLRQAVRDYTELVPATNQAPAVANIVRDLGIILRRNGELTGPQYQAFRSRFDRAARAARQDPQLSDAMFGIRNAIDDAMGRSMSAADQAAWREVRTQYRNMLVVEKLATGANAEAAQGLIKPQALLSAVAGQNRRDLARGRGDFADLAKAGRAVLQELPNSGTPARQAAMQILNIFGGTIAGIPGALASAGGQSLGARLLMSGPGQRYLGNQTMARAIQNANAQTPWPLIGAAAAQRGLLAPENER